MTTQPTAATIAEVEHHTAEVNGTTLHYVRYDSGSPILLVHGFPESWWAFHKLIPLLAQHHRVYAVDLRGFGDSSNAEGDYSTATSAEDLHQLIGDLAVGPMHVLGQDISGGVVYRLAATHPTDVLSLTGVETGLAGFGAEKLADATQGGAWYIGALVTPGIAELLFAGREADFIAGHLYPSFGVVAPAVTEADTTEFVRTYARPDGFRGAIGLYGSMLSEGEEMRALAATSPLSMPVLAIGSFGGPFTASALQQVSAKEISTTELASCRSLRGAGSPPPAGGEHARLPRAPRRPGRGNAGVSNRDGPAPPRHLGGPAVIIGQSISGGAATIAAATAPEVITGVIELAPFTRKQPVDLGGLVRVKRYRAGATWLGRSCVPGKSVQPGRSTSTWRTRSSPPTGTASWRASRPS